MKFLRAVSALVLAGGLMIGGASAALADERSQIRQIPPNYASRDYWYCPAGTSLGTWIFQAGPNLQISREGRAADSSSHGGGFGADIVNLANSTTWMRVTYTCEVVDEGPATTIVPLSTHNLGPNDPYLMVVELCPESHPEFVELAVNEDRLPPAATFSYHKLRAVGEPDGVLITVDNAALQSGVFSGSLRCRRLSTS
ncbi:hypothetical protein FDA94_01265 [Herbidospora galbida]|uniref:Uncharacterized protein n=1 Tax=Herbidospora galbida TaxID=2575442 RepID=A0A4V5V089_9ACTN|nr:hypothetical protein [Herbidospora galbida]TKK91443.1 hypothetical protein FDA94_01265 [Herbidospora galbida]